MRELQRAIYCWKVIFEQAMLLPIRPPLTSRGSSAAQENSRRTEAEGVRKKSFCRQGTDHAAYLRDFVCRKTALGGVFAYHFFVRSDVNAIDFIVGHVAFHPLDGRTEMVEYAARFLGNGVQLVLRKIAHVGDLSLNDILGHEALRPVVRGAKAYSEAPPRFKAAAFSPIAKWL